MLEIDIDVGRFVPFTADEPLEQQIQPIGIDTGDPQAVAHHAVGRRTSPLAQNAARPSESHQVPYRQEIGFILQFLDQLHLVFQQTDDFIGDAVRVSTFGPLPRQPLQVIDRSLSVRSEFHGIRIPELSQPESNPLSHFLGAGNRLGVIPKGATDFGQAAQVI